jgi:hypothetical protein
MALTADQRRRLESLLSNKSKTAIDAILATAKAFLEWLQGAAKDLWSALKDIVKDIWNEIVSAFKK